jgi:hypothetical protein
MWGAKPTPGSKLCLGPNEHLAMTWVGFVLANKHRSTVETSIPTWGRVGCVVVWPSRIQHTDTNKTTRNSSRAPSQHSSPWQAAPGTCPPSLPLCYSLTWWMACSRHRSTENAQCCNGMPCGSYASSPNKYDVWDTSSQEAKSSLILVPLTIFGIIFLRDR